ncbi:MAG: ureidoglycolate lyase [Pseudomonadota bacterium]
MHTLVPQKLTEEGFAPFGEVIDLRTAKQIPINYGLTTRFDNLCTVDTANERGRTLVNVFRTDPIPLPHTVTIMERHPLGSQAFIPMSQNPFLVLVAPPSDTVSAKDLRLFITNGQQGINFHKNTWHHYQLVLNEQMDFIVVDRGGDGNNLQEIEVEGDAVIHEPPVIV